MSEPARAPTSIQLSPRRTVAPMRSSTSVNRTSPWMLARPTPSTRTAPPVRVPLIAPAARKYEADEASPSTWISRGERYDAAGTVKLDQSVRVAGTPKRAIKLSVIST